MLKILITFLALSLANAFAQSSLNKNELSLKAAISIALKNNPEIKAAESEITASEGKYLGNFWLEPPKVSFSFEAVPTNKSLRYFGERYIEVSQSFNNPFGLYYNAGSLSLQTSISRSDFDHQVLQLTVNIKRIYSRALAESEKLKILERNTLLMEDFLQKNESRFNVGEGTQLEFLTAKVRYSEARNLLEQSKNNYKNTLYDLALLLGMADTDDVQNIRLTDSLDSRIYDFNPDDLIRTSDQNPELRSAALAVSRSSYDKKLAWSKLLPSFDLAYFRETIAEDPNFYGVSIGVSIPLWFMFSERGNIQEASANQKSAEYALTSKQLEVAARIRKAYNIYSNEKNQLNTYKNEILPLAEEVYRTASASYDAGEISYIEFLQAQQTLISARNNFIDMLLNYNLALIAIEEAAGKTVTTATEN